MPPVLCPFPACDYTADDADTAIVAALLNAHSATHMLSHNVAAKVKKVKRPTISDAGSSEDWAYFQSRWTEYVDVTKVTGRDKVVQLLECCDNQLRKNLNRSAVEA